MAGDEDDYEVAILRIKGYGDEPVENVAAFLLALDQAYAGLVQYHFLLDRLYSRGRRLRRYEPRADFDSFQSGQTASWSPNVLPPGFRLILKGVRLQSPGFWDFFGKLNPLEVLRNAINDAHERRKDRKYRESAEERRMRLENMIKENEAIGGRIAILRDLGMTDEEMAQVRTILIHQPMEKLLEHQNSRLIGSAELNPSPGRDSSIVPRRPTK
ncbi:hypothetical protein [Mesorhizobium sp.]|uniref:hypothetical protein n=1 Tax=Mesorhizobium sp. TaxID=1871066 RepID=UPI000FE90309|nr:hypothetical protein [Mesorhizobium sp.]RWK64309.1 MAG: hypothetical protein EOR49_06460 [Mesorhizobium sp.]RWM52071.1 MAG: hypothetical protein EOR76_04245 [Mesorhizobium sp.]RWM55286.1 MAG: hypothetical protein EOR78_15240 [Mesorhizobium sp.]RWM55950.1 MAG: hypothetical protein EOR79_19855 [Mesorhizobium sp.]RWN03989.1 MAG: hypothetical protein EOR85_08505 [Mesorhizobium sp.]